jgi:hypothetical protein
VRDGKRGDRRIESRRQEKEEKARAKAEELKGQHTLYADAAHRKATLALASSPRKPKFGRTNFPGPELLASLAHGVVASKSSALLASVSSPTHHKSDDAPIARDAGLAVSAAAGALRALGRPSFHILRARH